MHSVTNQTATEHTIPVFNPMVSVCENVYHVTNLGKAPLSEVLYGMRDGYCDEQISVIRAVLNDTLASHEEHAKLDEQLDHVLSITLNHAKRAEFAAARARYYSDPHSEPLRVELVRWLKTSLRGILFSGLFDKRANKGLDSHSGTICIDVDDLPDPAAKRDEIGGDIHCLGVGLSPSGTGLKIVVRVPPTDSEGHTTRTFPAVSAYLKEKFGTVADKAARDVSRLCYMSWDPEMRINLNAEEMDIPEVGFEDLEPSFATTPSHTIPLTPTQDYNTRGDVVALLRDHNWTSSDEVHWGKPGKEAATTATLGMTKGPPRSLWVFSDNAPPFEPGKQYEPWRIFSMLECNGDDSEAFTKLQALGFGASTDDSLGIFILPSNLGRTITASARSIFPVIAKALTIFSRGGVVQEVVSSEDGSRLEVMSAKAFRSRLEKYGRPMAWRSERGGARKLSPAICAEETAAALLVTTEALALLPPIRSVLASPVLALDGQVLVTLKQGWNPQSGGVFVIGAHVPPVVQLEEAVGSLLTLLGDFDFHSDGDVSRALAALITPALKAGGLLTGTTPIEVCEADKSQAGKGFFFKAIAAIYAETPSFIAQKEGGVGSLDESISAALIAGRSFIQLDNMRGKVASTLLEAMITANAPFPCRVPHKGTVEVDTRPFTFSMTSNGVATTRDLANRCSIIRIKKRPEDYVFQSYSEGGLHNHIVANQPYYLGCVFAIVREWVAQGRKRTTEHRHDFRDWAQTLDWIVTSVFEVGPLMEGHNAARDRVSDQGRSWLRAIALKLAEDGRLGFAYRAAELAEISAENDIALPNVRSESTGDKAPALAVGRAMGRLFNGNSSVSVDDYLVTRTQSYSASAEKDGWSYSFMLS